MKLAELSKPKLVALAIQFKAFSSVTAAATKSAAELIKVLETNPAIQELVNECCDPVDTV